MARSVAPASASKSKKAAKEKTPVNPVAPGTPVQLSTDIIKLKVIETENGPMRYVTIDKKKRIKGDPTANELVERALLLKSLAGIYDHDAEALKQLCFEQGAKFVDSTNGTAQIIPGGDGGSVDVAKFWKLCEAKKIPLAKRFEAMSVGKEKATNILSGDDIKGIITPPETPPQPRITVTRNKDSAPTTVSQALTTLAKQAAAGKIGDWEPKPKKSHGASDE
jgi:hypothetical protein